MMARFLAEPAEDEFDTIGSSIRNRDEALALTVKLAGQALRSGGVEIRTKIRHGKNHLFEPGLIPEWLGRSADEVMSTRFHQYLHPDDVEASEWALEAPRGVMLGAFANRYRHADGRFIPMVWIPWNWDGEIGEVDVYRADLAAGASKALQLALDSVWRDRAKGRL